MKIIKVTYSDLGNILVDKEEFSGSFFYLDSDNVLIMEDFLEDFKYFLERDLENFEEEAQYKIVNL